MGRRHQGEDESIEGSGQEMNNEKMETMMATTNLEQRIVGDNCEWVSVRDLVNQCQIGEKFLLKRVRHMFS